MKKKIVSLAFDLQLWLYTNYKVNTTLYYFVPYRKGRGTVPSTEIEMTLSFKSVLQIFNCMEFKTAFGSPIYSSAGTLLPYAEQAEVPYGICHSTRRQPNSTPFQTRWAHSVVVWLQGCNSHRPGWWEKYWLKVLCYKKVMRTWGVFYTSKS